MVLPDSIRHQFEAGLLNELQSQGNEIILEPGEKIIDVDQTVRIIPLVLKGMLKVSRIDHTGRELLLYYVGTLESCAMTFTCCMQIFPSEVRIVAECESVIAGIPIDKMDAWMSKYPTWKAFVMNTIRNRFNELLRTIDQIAFQRLDERLTDYLKDKSKATGSTLINLSHEQIATEMATSRVVISRLLKKLEDQQKVLLYRNQIKLLRDL